MDKAVFETETKKTGPGRPPNNEQLVVIGVRLPPRLLDRIKLDSKKRGVNSASTLIRIS